MNDGISSVIIYCKFPATVSERIVKICPYFTLIWL